jgi:hypothetical protein
MLLTSREREARHQGGRLNPVSDDELVFKSPEGLPIDDQNFCRRAWKTVLAEFVNNAADVEIVDYQNLQNYYDLRESMRENQEVYDRIVSIAARGLEILDRLDEVQSK